jgi:AraC-like DNA-binding protein
MTSVHSYEIDISRGLSTTWCGVRHPMTSPFTQRKRIMADFIVFLVVEGEIQLTDYMSTGPERFIVKPGEIHVIAPGLAQESTIPFAVGIKFLWWHFSVRGKTKLRTEEETLRLLKEDHQMDSEPHPRRRWFIPRHANAKHFLSELQSVHTQLLENSLLWSIQDPACQFLGGRLTHVLHLTNAKSMMDVQNRDSIRPDLGHVARAKQFIRLHHDRSITLRDVAKHLSLNASYLSRLFQEVTGQTLTDYLQQVRIENAKNYLMEHSPLSIKETAFKAGFGTSAYFCRIFRQLEGTTPRGFASKATKAHLISEKEPSKAKLRKPEQR